MTIYKYKVDIRWSDEDDAFIARAPELDGVVTHGATLVEAAKHLDEAIKLHLHSLAKHGEEIPEPIALDKLSGKYPLRMGKERHQDLVVKAQAAGLSVNEYLNQLIDSSEEYQTRAPRRTLISEKKVSYLSGGALAAKKSRANSKAITEGHPLKSSKLKAKTTSKRV